MTNYEIFMKIVKKCGIKFIQCSCVNGNIFTYSNNKFATCKIVITGESLYIEEGGTGIQIARGPNDIDELVKVYKELFENGTS